MNERMRLGEDNTKESYQESKELLIKEIKKIKDRYKEKYGIELIRCKFVPIDYPLFEMIHFTFKEYPVRRDASPIKNWYHYLNVTVKNRALKSDGKYQGKHLCVHIPERSRRTIFLKEDKMNATQLKNYYEIKKVGFMPTDGRPEFLNDFHKTVTKEWNSIIPGMTPDKDCIRRRKEK